MSPVEETTIMDVIDAARTMFRVFGFDALEPRIDLSNDNPRLRRGFVTVSFAEEVAKGQAAFSQTKVQCSLEFHCEQLEGPEVQYVDALMALDDIEHRVFTLRVRYEHHDGGSNGVSRRFTYHTRRNRLVEYLY